LVKLLTRQPNSVFAITCVEPKRDHCDEFAGKCRRPALKFGRHQIESWSSERPLWRHPSVGDGRKRPPRNVTPDSWRRFPGIHPHVQTSRVTEREIPSLAKRGFGRYVPPAMTSGIHFKAPTVISSASGARDVLPRGHNRTALRGAIMTAPMKARMS